MEKFDALEWDDTYENQREKVDGLSREQRMSKIWDLLTPPERKEMMLFGGMLEIYIGEGQEYNPFLSWKDCGCSQKTAITNHCLRIFNW